MTNYRITFDPVIYHKRHFKLEAFVESLKSWFVVECFLTAEEAATYCQNLRDKESKLEYFNSIVKHHK